MNIILAMYLNLKLRVRYAYHDIACIGDRKHDSTCIGDLKV